MTHLQSFCILLLFICSTLAEDVKILPGGVTECDTEGTSITFKTYLYEKDDGSKAFTGDLDLPYSVNTSFTFTMQVDKYDDTQSKWQENAFNIEGEVCDYIQRIMPKLWTNMRSSISPAIDEECNIPPNQYTLEGFEANYDDVNVPQGMIGKFRLVLKVFTPDDENVLCKKMEGEIVKV